jgi:PAS domain S-box-containing protein
MAKPSDKSGKKSSARKGPASEPRDSDEIIPARQLSILIVDDDPVDRMTVLRALRGTKLNPKITEATDIASATDLIKKNGFDVILLDHILPDGKSIDLLRRLRDAGIRIPVVVTTGYGDEMLVADLLKTGAADYLSKDRISADSVSRAISHAIRIHKIEEEKLKKDTLLEAGAEAVILLNTQTDRISVVSGALGILGKALGVDRLTAFEQAMHPTAKLPTISHRFEWSRDAEDFKFNDPGLQNMTFLSLGLARWHAVISNGHSIGGAVRLLPSEEQQFFTGRGVISILAVPVLVDGRCWGFVLIEDHHVERTWTEREKARLTSVATAIGSTLMHQRADEALRQSEERFRAILEAQTDYICRFLPNGTVTFVNEACCQYSGRKREELIGRSFFTYVAEPDRQELMDALAALSPRNPVRVSENRSISPDGKIVWGQWTNRGIFNPQGQLIEIQGVGRDITERKRAEEALNRSESSLATALQMAHAGHWEYDVASDTFTFNDNFYRIFRTTAREVGGYKMRSAEYARKFCHPEDIHRVAAEIKASNETADPNYSRLLEHRILYADGKIGFINVRFFVVKDEQGRTIRTYGVNQDITEQKTAEGRLRALEAVINQSPAIAFLCRNIEGLPVDFVSDNVLQFGYTAEDVISGKVRLVDIIHPDDLPRLLRETNDNILQGIDDFVQEYRIRTRTGKIRWLEDQTRAIRDAQGRVTHLQSVVWDVTDRRNAEQAVKESREYLDEIINSISDPIFVKDEKHRFVLVNDAHTVIAGKPREQIIGKTDYDFFPKEQVDVFWAFDEKVLETGEENVNEECITNAGGETRTIITKKTRYTDPLGNRFIVGVIRDITVRKKAEEELRLSDARWKAHYKGYPVPTFTWQKQGEDFVLVDFNNAAIDMTRDGISNARGQTARVLHKDFPDGIAHLWRCYNSKSTFSEEMDYQLVTTGETRRLNSTLVFVPPDQVMVHAEDITERRRAEQELRASEEQLRAQYKGFPIPTFTWTCVEDDFVLTDFNDAGIVLTEGNIGKYKGCKVTEFHKNRPDIVEDVRRCMNDKVTFCREYDLHFQTTGKVRRLSVTYVYVPHNQVMLHAEDVTERRLAEMAIRDSEAQYRTLAEASPDMIFMCAPNSDIVYANSVGARQWNLRPEQIAGKKQEELFSPESAARHKKAIRMVCETRKPFFSEVTEMLQQSKVWIETRLVPITNAAGEVTAVLGVSRNITERRKMEEAVRESETNFRALAENAMDGIIIVSGEDARFVYANKAALDLSGYTSDDIQQRSLWDIIIPEMHHDARATFQRRMAGDPSVPKRYETFAVRKDGRRFPVDVSIARTVWRGSPAMLAIARDVSLQKQLEMERSRLASSLLDIQEKERQEISSMLHDHLGQLLTLTRLELGSVGSYDASSKKSITNAIERIDEALGSVRRLAVSLRPPILDDLGIDVALETLTEEFADGSSIQTSFTHEGPKPALGNAEETCLYRVLQEALTNAAKHSGATRIDVQLRTSRGEVCLEIHDNGKGFDAEAQQTRGGIGFIGMRERLSRCGGTLDVISEADEGTTVRARIPKTDQEITP